MNKEQKKPQEECHCQLDCEEPCLVNWEHSKNCPNMQTPQEEWITGLEKMIHIFSEYGINYCQMCGANPKRIKNHIKTNFIAKRDLRKLLEGVSAKFHGGGNGRRLLIELMERLNL